MAKWRAGIITRFTPALGRSVVVVDPDRLLTDPTVNEALTTTGFDLLVFEDPVAFRFAYESKHRSHVDTGLFSDLIILYHGQPAESLPFDVLTRSDKIALSLADFFPNLSYPVISALQPECFDTLYEAQERFSPGMLGDNATKDFVLHHVFAIAAELVRSDADLLRVLLRHHYRSQAIPAVFIDRLVKILEGTLLFGEWPLSLLFTKRPAFLSFLQERWPKFLHERFGSPSVTSSLTISGPARLPFDSPDVRVYMDNLFAEGLLQPVECEPAESKTDWIAVGVRHNSNQDSLERFQHLLSLVESTLPTITARHADWQRFAELWAQLNLVAMVIDHGEPRSQGSRFTAIREKVDADFRAWMLKRFASLHNLPSSPPVMVHHIPRYLAQHRDGAKVALLVVDGLALDQWIVVRDEISTQRPKWTFEEQPVFAWVPTVTSVSRQSIFAARAPFYFPASIYGTGKEASLWTQFWADHGFSAAQIAYIRSLGDMNSLTSIDEVLSAGTVNILGAVVDKVDRIMHGMELGSAGMHNQVAQWGRSGFLVSAMETLMSAGFDTYITSDHGNVEAAGIGRPREGMLADVKGERVRIFPDETLRAAVASKFDNAISWPLIGLPDQFLPLLAPDRAAFVPLGQATVAHGSITIEEVIVPFVRIAGGV